MNCSKVRFLYRLCNVLVRILLSLQSLFYCFTLWLFRHSSRIVLSKNLPFFGFLYRTLDYHSCILFQCSPVKTHQFYSQSNSHYQTCLFPPYHVTLFIPHSPYPNIPSLFPLYPLSLFPPQSANFYFNPLTQFKFFNLTDSLNCFFPNSASLTKHSQFFPIQT